MKKQLEKNFHKSQLLDQAQSMELKIDSWIELLVFISFSFLSIPFFFLHKLFNSNLITRHVSHKPRLSYGQRRKTSCSTCSCKKIFFSQKNIHQNNFSSFKVVDVAQGLIEIMRRSETVGQDFEFIGFEFPSFFFLFLFFSFYSRKILQIK